jgi:N-acetylneuraminate synthase
MRFGRKSRKPTTSLGCLRNWGAGNVKKRCWIIGNGPSLAGVDLSLLRDEDTFGCNCIFKVFEPTYYCLSDPIIMKIHRIDLENILPHSRFFIKKGIDVRRPCTFMEVNNDVYREIQKEEEKSGERISEDVRDRMIREEDNKFLECENYDLTLKTAPWARSVVMEMCFPIAVSMGYKEIFLLGCDATNNGHFYGRGDGQSNCEYSLKERQWVKTKELCEKNGVTVVNCSKGSKVPIFDKMDYREVLKKKSDVAEFVAEFTTNHMGNLNVLLRMVEKAAWAGADFIKMQKKDVKSFYERSKLEAEYESPYGHTYEDYRTIFEFGDEDYERFDKACCDHGIQWFTTIQDIPSLLWMLKYDLPMYKVASCNSSNMELLSEVSKLVGKDKRIIVSVAGKTLDQVRQTIDMFPKHRMNVLHCVAEYPCLPVNCRLGNIAKLKEEFEDERISIGYSGHESGFVPTLAAISLGASMIERHFCLSRHSFVHHIECSLEPDEFKGMVRAARGNDLEEVWRPQLPSKATDCSFGMSEMEYNFLEKKTYGDDYLRAKRGSRLDP